MIGLRMCWPCWTDFVSSAYQAVKRRFLFQGLALGGRIILLPLHRYINTSFPSAALSCLHNGCNSQNLTPKTGKERLTASRVIPSTTLRLRGSATQCRAHEVVNDFPCFDDILDCFTYDLLAGVLRNPVMELRGKVVPVPCPERSH